MKEFKNAVLVVLGAALLAACTAQRGTSGFLEAGVPSRSLALAPHYGFGALAQIESPRPLDDMVQCVADVVARQRPRLSVNLAILSPSSDPDPLDADRWLDAGGSDRIARLARAIPDDLVALIGYVLPDGKRGREVAVRALVLNLRETRVAGGVTSRASAAEFGPTWIALDRAACAELGERLAEAVAP